MHRAVLHGLRADVSQAKSLSRAGVSLAGAVPRLGEQLMALNGVGRQPLGAAAPALALQQQMAAARMMSLGGLGGLAFGPLGLPAASTPGATNLAAALLSMQMSNPFSLPAALSGLSSLVTPPPAPPPALPVGLESNLLAGAGMGGGLVVGDLLKQLQFLQAAAGAAAPPAPPANPLLSALALAFPQASSAPTIPTPPVTSQPSRAPAAPNVAPSLLAQMQALFNLSGGGAGALGGGELALSQLAALGFAGQPLPGSGGGGGAGGGAAGVGGGLAPQLFSLDALSLMQPVTLDSLSK